MNKSKSLSSAGPGRGPAGAGPEGSLAVYLERTLGSSFGDLLNDGRVSPRTDHLLWQLESALGGLPVGHLMDLLVSSPYIDFEELRKLRAALADEARSIMEYDLGL